MTLNDLIGKLLPSCMIKEINEMTRKIKIFKTSLFSIVRGMATPAQVYEVHIYRYPHKSDLEAMRKDWELVGNAFRAVILREYGKAAAK